MSQSSATSAKHAKGGSAGGGVQRQLSIQQSFPSIKYIPCGVDVRAPVLHTATGPDSYIVKQQRWTRLVSDMKYTVKIDSLSTRASGWRDLRSGDTVTIRRDSGLPSQYHNLKCTLKELNSQDQAQSGTQGMWKLHVLSAPGNKQISREIHLHATGFMKVHSASDDFDSLRDETWIGAEAINVFLTYMSRSLGWGFGSMPPRQLQVGTTKQIWIANAFLFRNIEMEKMGCQWINVGAKRPEFGSEIPSQSLSDYLRFTLNNLSEPEKACPKIAEADWRHQFQSLSLDLHSFIRVGDEYFKPDPSWWISQCSGTPCTGVTGDVDPRKFKSQLQSETSEHMEQNKSEAIQTFRTLALSVTHAIIPTNPSNVHWRYGIVDLTKNIITLDGPMGSDPHPVPNISTRINCRHRL